MADDAQLYGLTAQQHAMVGRVVLESGVSKRPSPPPKQPARFPPLARVIAPATRTYDSLISTDCVGFTYDRNRTIYNIEFVGSVLAGYFILQINDVEFVVECRRESLADIVNAVPKLQRAAVLPGLWELDFGDADPDDITIEASSMSAEAADDLCAALEDDDCIFNGSALVRREAWFTVPGENGVPSTVAVTDAIPYTSGSVGPGAIGTACWAWGSGYVVTGWQCRQFSFASGYDPDADVIDPTTGEPDPEGESGGGLPSEEIPL